MADNDDDNLRIFDDVENVVKEVQEEEQTTAEKITLQKPAHLMNQQLVQQTK